MTLSCFGEHLQVIFYRQCGAPAQGIDDWKINSPSQVCLTGAKWL